MPIEVTSTIADDWAAVRDLRLRALTDAPTAFGSTLERELGFGEQTWRERAANPLSVVARVDQRLVGIAAGVFEPHTGAGCVQLVAMYVEPAFRGTGCAHRLIDAVAAGARRRGARRMLLLVTDVNPVAAGCYRRYGFVPTGRTLPLPHSPGITEIEMGLDLSVPSAPVRPEGLSTASVASAGTVGG